MNLSPKQKARIATLGGRVKVARLNRRMTAKYVGDQLGVTKAAISCWEHDTLVNPPPKLFDFARLTRVSLEWLLEGKDPPSDLDLSIDDDLLTGQHKVQPMFRKQVKHHETTPAVEPGRLLTEFGPHMTLQRMETVHGGQGVAFRAGDFCVVDTSHKRVSDAGTYIVRFEDGSAGRAIATAVDNGGLVVKVVIDDQKAKPHGGLPTFEVLGRVVGVLTMV